MCERDRAGREREFDCVREVGRERVRVLEI